MKDPRLHRILLILLAVFSTQVVSAQLHFGFNGGLTISNIRGPVEEVSEGDGESFSSLTGFHIGLRARYDLNDWLAIGSGFGYSQKGSRYRYNGPSYFRFRDDRNETFPFFQGTREVQMDINTDHLDIPLIIQLEPFNGVQFYGGPYASFTLAARATGALRFTPAGAPQLNVGLEYNYFSDELGLDPDIMTEEVIIDGDEYTYPLTMQAYYDRDELDGNLFEVLDYGLKGGLNLFVNSGLYLNGEIMYGLNDMTNDRADISIATRDLVNQDFVYRDDFDRFVTYKISIGFAF